MAEEVKSKKVRVYKLASEYNLSAEQLIEFLKKKGHDIKSHMTILTDEMLIDIQNHFKKDIEKAEKHYKKIAEFNKKRIERSEEEAKKGAKPEEEVKPKEAEEVLREKEEEVVPPPQVEEKVEEKPQVVTESPITEVAEEAPKAEEVVAKEEKKPE